MATSMKRRAGGKVNGFSAVIQGDVGSAENVSKQTKKINSELGNAKSRDQGLEDLEQLLQLQNVTILAENITTWLKTLSQSIIQENNERAGRNFTTILSQACQVPSISREIATNVIPNILTNFLQGKNESSSLVLNSIEAVISAYPASCGNLRSQIVKLMLPLMMSSLERDDVTVFRCWSMVPFLGGGGTQRSTHKEQWEKQLQQTIKALKFAFQNFIGEDTEEKLDPAIGSLSLPFSHLPSTEPELSNTLLQRICVTCRCLRSLLNVDFPHPVQIPVNFLLTTILEILDITPKQMGNTSEMLLRASFLRRVHQESLEVLKNLCRICKKNLCRYSSKINRLFSGLLDVWKSKNATYGKDKDNSDIRTQIYITIIEWLQNCGSTTGFLCGAKHLNQSLVKHLLDDVTPVKNALQVSNTKLQSSGGSKKAKKRRYAEATQEMLNGSTTDKIVNPMANSQLAITALKVAAESITTMEHRLSPNIHKIFQETVITLLLQIQQGQMIIPYSSCPSSRLSLYKVLLSLTLSPVPSLAPPMALCIKIFNFASSREASPKIRSYCRDGIAALNNIIHPWRNAWHTCGVETRAANFPTEVSPIIEPMNLDDSVKNTAEVSDSEDDSAEVTSTTNIPKGNNKPQERSPYSGMESEDINSEDKTEIPVPANKEKASIFEEPHPSEQQMEIPDSPLECELETDNQADHRTEKMADPENVTNSLDDSNAMPSSSDDVVTATTHGRQEPVSGNADDPEVEENLEELNEMILDFVDASPERETETE